MLSFSLWSALISLKLDFAINTVSPQLFLLSSSIPLLHFHHGRKWCPSVREQWKQSMLSRQKGGTVVWFWSPEEHRLKAFNSKTLKTKKWLISLRGKWPANDKMPKYQWQGCRYFCSRKSIRILHQFKKSFQYWFGQNIMLYFLTFVDMLNLCCHGFLCWCSYK